MNRLTYFTILIALLLGCNDDTINDTVIPNVSEIEWRMYNVGNSLLPNNQVNAIAIDKSDNKWLGTANGLVKIIGETWTVFNTLNTPLPSSNIRCIAIGNGDEIWVGTDKGLANYSNNKWSVYTNINSVLSSNSITCITYDSASKTTWVGTDEGIIKIDKENKWHYIFINDLVLSMTTDSFGNLWTGVFNPFAFVGKIKSYVDGKWTTYNLPDLGYPSSFPYAMGADGKGHIFIVLSGTAVQSLLNYNGTKWEEIERPEKARGLKTILLDNGKAWVGGYNLSLFGNRLNECLTIPDSGVIQTIAVDSKGKKWLGTLNGLVVLSRF